MVIYHIDMVILDIDMGDEANELGDDRIDMVISHIDMGYLVTLRMTLSPSILSCTLTHPHTHTLSRSHARTTHTR